MKKIFQTKKVVLMYRDKPRETYYSDQDMFVELDKPSGGYPTRATILNAHNFTSTQNALNYDKRGEFIVAELLIEGTVTIVQNLDEVRKKQKKERDEKEARRLLNSLCEEGVPLNIVERLTIMCDGTLKDGEETFACYKYFDGIDKPLFFFNSVNYGHQNAVWHTVDGKEVLRPQLKLSLYLHNNASLVLYKPRDRSVFTEDLYDFIKRFMNANISHVTESSSEWTKQNHQMYKIREDAGAFFQGGSDSFHNGFLYIEFWKPKGAQAFVDYVNNTFVYEGFTPSPVESMEYY